MTPLGWKDWAREASCHPRSSRLLLHPARTYVKSSMAVVNAVVSQRRISGKQQRTAETTCQRGRSPLASYAAAFPEDKSRGSITHPECLCLPVARSHDHQDLQRTPPDRPRVRVLRQIPEHSLRLRRHRKIKAASCQSCPRKKPSAAVGRYFDARSERCSRSPLERDKGEGVKIGQLDEIVDCPIPIRPALSDGLRVRTLDRGERIRQPSRDTLEREIRAEGREGSGIVSTCKARKMGRA
jgi:hypothetical protein